VIPVKNSRELERMRLACALSAEALALAGQSITAGMTTWDLDHIIGEFITSNGAKASFLGYGGFKGNACISINEELIHGIPSKKRVIKDGDIVTVDVGAYIDGFHGDNAATFAVGKVTEEAENLMNVTRESLYKGIAQARAGNRIGDIGHAVQSYCEERGYFVSKQWIGHGVGAELHEDPEVPNYGRAGHGLRLVPGMTLAIEPMVLVSTDRTRRLSDGWTVVEANGKLCAHFEHTVAVTEGDPIILTLPRASG
jgi:methionyl aminopeptidase